MYVLEIVNFHHDKESFENCESGPMYYDTDHPLFFTTKEKAIAFAEKRLKLECEAKNIECSFVWETSVDSYTKEPVFNEDDYDNAELYTDYTFSSARQVFNHASWIQCNVFECIPEE